MSPKFDENKVFLRTWGEITNRFDPNYYKKVYMDLERAVAKQTKYKLRDFIKLMAGGVTPKITEYDKYYSDSVKGIPFLRVQNLSPEGLDCSDCKYINEETHNGLLKRSQVSQGDLLIKITGVGRMAITSIAPEGFEGNINQHIVVLKTKRPELNEQIATFLNSDIGEMLATHRSTGGTRPALDYTALRSIPIILNDSISDIMNEAYEKKKMKEKEAQSLSNSINDYLLHELDIVIQPQRDNTLEKRIFYTKSDKVFGNRFDTFYYQEKYKEYEKSLFGGKYPVSKLGSYITDISYGASVNNYYKETGIPLLRIKNVKPNEIDSQEIVYLSDKMEKELYHSRVNTDDILITRSGTIGVCSVVDEFHDNFAFGSFMIKFSLVNIMPQYVSYVINSYIGKRYFERNKIGAIQGNITIPTIKSLRIPVPPIEVQSKIVHRIEKIRLEVKRLEQDAKDIVTCAKKQVEEKLLGDNL